jgi:hypothetical protein
MPQTPLKSDGDPTPMRSSGWTLEMEDHRHEQGWQKARQEES